MKTVPFKRQVPKPILLEGIGNGGNGAFIWSTAILLTNDQHFMILRSVEELSYRLRSGLLATIFYTVRA